MASSDPEKISFSKIIKDIDLYFSKKSEVFLEKTPSFLKENFLGIPVGIIGILFFTAFTAQLRWWGNRFPFFDQLFYLFGGEQILHGKIPYIDFWDCKPVGLFLLYAFIRLFDPYQYYVLPIISSLSLFFGSLGLYRLTHFFGSKTASFCAGFSFILIEVSAKELEDGQSEQFFLPLVIWAIALIFLHFEQIQSSLARLFYTGCASMLLFGIAIEIKSVCVFEGILTGLFLLLLLIVQHKISLSKRLFLSCIFGITWVVFALTPTLLIVSWYAKHHFLQDWIFANIQSNPLRVKWLSTYVYQDLYKIHLEEATLAFLGLSLGFYVYLKNFFKKLHATNSFLPSLFIFLWAGITLLSATYMRSGLSSFHYMLPVAVPLLLIGALLWQQSLLLKNVCVFTFLISSTLLIVHIITKVDTTERTQTTLYLEKKITQQSGCLFQLTGYPGTLLQVVLTEEIESCLTTKYIFPDHLFDPQYRLALPINPEAELRRILSSKPLYLALPNKINCSPISTDCLFPEFNYVWSINVFPEREWQLLENTLQDYIPLYQDKNWGFYKLKPGLTPGITPPNIKAVPSLPVQKIALPQKPNKKLERLKKIVASWPED